MTRKAMKTTAMIGRSGITTERVVTLGREELTDIVGVCGIKA
jgi:hypothetical protein